MSQITANLFSPSWIKAEQLKEITGNFIFKLCDSVGNSLL